MNITIEKRIEDFCCFCDNKKQVNFINDEFDYESLQFGIRFCICLNCLCKLKTQVSLAIDEDIVVEFTGD